MGMFPWGVQRQWMEGQRGTKPDPQAPLPSQGFQTPQSAQPRASHHGSLGPVPLTSPPLFAGRDAPHHSFSLLLPTRTQKFAFRNRHAACAIRTAAPGADGGVGVTAASRIWGQRGSRAAGRGEGLGLSGGELNIFSICELNIFSILGCGGAET